MDGAKRYRSMFIEPGLVGYADGNRQETVLVKKEALDKMLPSFLGKPVFNFVHKDIGPDQAFDLSNSERDELADGVIAEVGYDDRSGWYFADLMIWDEETIKNIDENGYSVSCAYIPTESGESGTHNSMDYDEEVLDGEYQHMAIVDEPRYNGSKIYANSKRGGIMKFKIGKKKVKENMEDKPVEEPEVKDNMGEIPEDAMVEIDGQMVPVSELVSAYSNKNADEPEEAENMLNMEDTVDVGGEQVSVKDLVENYCGMKKENAEDATDDELNPTVKENAADKVEDDPKFFKVVKNAADRGAAIEKPNVNTQTKRLDRGKSMYGSAVKQEVN